MGAAGKRGRGGRYIYHSLAAAKQKTGHFSLYSIKMSQELGLIVLDFIRREGLVTHTGVNQRHTSDNTYTSRFCLKMYAVHEKKTNTYAHYAYLDGRGALGYMYQYGEDEKLQRVEGAPLGKTWQMVHTGEASRKIEELRARTPTLEQMYFWICRKYPEHVLWVNCSHEPGLIFGRREV